jgi:uncharacterized protein YajQ (UPF0234 family)
LRAQEPALSPKLAGGVWFEEDALIDPRALLAALRVAAERRGAEFRSGSFVKRIAIAGGRAQGVELDDGRLVRGSHVVLAAGSWTVDIEQGKDEVTLVTDDEFRARAIRDLIESKAVRRGLDLKVFEWGPIEEAGGNKVRQQIGLRRGLDDPLAKRISKVVRDEFPKSKAQIQGDAVRVSGKSKDELQRVITRLKELDLDVPLQFQNYR